MNDFNTLFPNFSGLCFTLKNTLTPISYVLITGGWIATTLAGYQSGGNHFRAVGKIVVLLMLLVFLPTWGNQIVSAMDDLVKNVLQVDPAKIHDQYQAALQLKKSADGNSSWWERIFSFPSIMEALVSAVFLILGWLASTIEWWAYILQTAILFIGYALSPIFVGMLMFPSMYQVGRNYLLNLLGIMVWPLGWGVAGLITQGMITFMTDQTFLSSQGVSSQIVYSLQNLMGLAFLGIWIIFSTIAAPVIIQRAIAAGNSVASGLFSGAYAAGREAGTGGFMSLASSIGGKSISIGKDTFTKAGLKEAAKSGAMVAAAGTFAALTASETLATASINEGQGGSSLIGSLARMNGLNRARSKSEASSEKSSRGGFPPDDPAGDRTVADLIRKSKNPPS